jgi:radical SAM protein with 4Fe4S-binding SPASM domain
MNGSRVVSTNIDITWADEFIAKVKPYIYVREKDQLLIMIPNQAYRLNESGVQVLKFLLNANSISDFLEIVGDSQDKRQELHYFFCDLRAAVSGCLRENEKREAISYYEFTGEFSDYPVLSEIAVTYRCNLKCDFCYVGRKNYGELNTGDTKKVLFKIRYEAEVPSVSFTGGEPLLRSDIIELVDYASNIGLWTNLITNGTLLDYKKVMALKHAGLSSAQVSIEGQGPEIHDKITGINGSFAATVKGIRHLQDAGIPVHTNTTVSRRNLEHLEDIVALAKSLDLPRLSMNLIIPCGSALKSRDIWVSYSEIGDHILKIKHRADQEGIKFLWYSPVPMCKFNPISYGFGNKSCAAITGLLSLDPLGNILPCSSWPWPVASLLKKRFKDIWQLPMLSYFKNKEYAPQKCRECIHLDICKGACPLYWKACGLGELND